MGTVILEIGNFYLESVGLFESFLKNFFRVFIQCGASQMAQRLKDLPAMWEAWVRSLGQEDPWRRKWQPTPVFLPRESHGRRSLVGYSPQGPKELDTTERLHFHYTMWENLYIVSSGIFFSLLFWRPPTINMWDCLKLFQSSLMPFKFKKKI